MEPIITLSDGSSFNFTAPHRHKFDIVLIAHALSKICRFAGQVGTTEIYTVAQHCVLVSNMVPAGHELDALLHDAHEFVMGDMPAPLKLLCPDYCEIERRVEVACRRHFGLSDDKSQEVDDADKRLCRYEHRDLFPAIMPDGRRTPRGAETRRMSVWPSAVAKRQFLERFEELTRVA